MSEKNKFIFIHIYKNAGTSIRTALAPFIFTKKEYFLVRLLGKFKIKVHFGTKPFSSHASSQDIIHGLGRETYDKYFSFAFVRNPWDWQVSLYKYILRKKSHPQHKVISISGSFEDYIRWRCEEEVRLQKDFIVSDTGEILVDYVGRFENLERDFEIICNKIGISAKLPKLNVSNYKPYREYYTDESRKLVAEAFKEDIDFFGYEF